MVNPTKSRRLVAVACLVCAPTAFAGDTDVLTSVPVGSVEVRELPAISPDGTTALNLRLPPLVVMTPERPGKKRKSAPLTGSASGSFVGSSLALKDGAVALDLKGPAPTDLSSGAALNLNLPAGAVKAEASATVGKEVGQRAFWHKDAAEVEAELSGPLGTALTAAGENNLSLTYRAPESVGASDSKAHVVRTESQSGRASLSVPLDPVRVTVGGQTGSDRTQQGSPGDTASFTQSAVRTADHTAYVDVEWQPVDGVALKGGTAARVAAISWQNAHASNYRSVNPNLTATVTPLRDTTLTATVEQTVAPYDAAAFAGYAKADKKGDASGFQPDHAWQLRTRIEQKVGPASLTATYTAARQGTVTEYAEIDGVQAPATTPLVSRHSLTVSVNLPLAGVGLPHTDLTTEAEWRASRVVDPITSAARTASGEPGQRVSLRLSHNLPAHNLSIGFAGEFTGERASYQVSELSTTAPGGSVGAFLAYKPGNYELDFNVGGLCGATTRDDFFRGTRGSSQVERSSWQDNSGPTLKLELKKPF